MHLTRPLFFAPSHSIPPYSASSCLLPYLTSPRLVLAQSRVSLRPVSSRPASWLSGRANTSWKLASSARWNLWNCQSQTRASETSSRYRHDRAGVRHGYVFGASLSRSRYDIRWSPIKYLTCFGDTRDSELGRPRLEYLTRITERNVKTE